MSESNKQINIVIGLGRSGIGAAKLLRAEGENVLLIESKRTRDLEKKSEELKELGIKVELEKKLTIKTFQPWIPRIKRIVISPGIDWNHPTLNKLRQEKINIQSEIGIAWRRLKHIPWIGVTGTNGKTTVTYLLKHILDKNNVNVLSGGNTGHSATEIALSLHEGKQNLPEWIVMELSSYQIESAPEICPEIGIWTNLTPDHLERHKTIENYRNIKYSLIKNSAIKILNGDDEDISKYIPILNNSFWTSTNRASSEDFPIELWVDKEGFVIEENKKLFHSSSLKIPGNHNLQNLLLVTAAARKIGLSGESIKRSLKTFLGIKHRLEIIKKINGMTIINDSKATNFSAAFTGLSSINKPAIIIAGGKIKKGDASDWIRIVKQTSCGIILFGESANQLMKMLQSSSYEGDIVLCNDLFNASKNAFKMGLKKNVKTIILSPACASFDQFKDFEERGDYFKKIINSF